MNKVFVVVSVLALLCLGITSQADVFNLGSGLTNLEMVTVGDPGNAGELSGAGAGGDGPDRICGSVSYVYNIGKYEVTAAQYCDFLNHKAKTDPYGLYDNKMWSDLYGCKIERIGTDGSYSYRVAANYANRPANFVSFLDTCRFANWLNNGQVDADTEIGSYTLNGFNGPKGGIGRNTGWRWAITSEDEWYKAAYFKGGGTSVGYWDYPMQSNIPTIPINALVNPDAGNNANFWQGDYAIGSPYWRTIVGEFENSESAYGTFDQGGNVWEWNESILNSSISEDHRCIRGGSFYGYDGYGGLQASIRADYRQSNGHLAVGFRVVQIIPEPSSIIAMSSGLLSLLGIRRRKA